MYSVQLHTTQERYEINQKAILPWVTMVIHDASLVVMVTTKMKRNFSRFNHLLDEFLQLFAMKKNSKGY